MFNKPMRKGGRRPEEKKEFDQYILDLARVTRVTQGGKHMSFRACVIIGDRRGRVGYGLAKGVDVQGGVEKAVRQAKKRVITVPLMNETIPHMVYNKFKAAEVMLKPAPQGSGIIAGGAVRAVLDLAGIPNVSSKILGKTKNKISITKATYGALQKFKKVADRKVFVPNKIEKKVEEKNTPVVEASSVSAPVKAPAKKRTAPRTKKIVQK